MFLLRNINVDSININRFEAKLLSILEPCEQAFYNKYIDYIELANDSFRPVLKFYFNENDYILEGISKGMTIDEIFKDVRAIEMIARSLFMRMHGVSVHIENVTYDKLMKERNEITRLNKAMTKYEMLEMENEEFDSLHEPIDEKDPSQENPSGKLHNKVIRLFSQKKQTVK